MTQTIQAQEISLAQLSAHFGVERSDNSNFFPEWQQNLPELTNVKIQALNKESPHHTPMVGNMDGLARCRFIST